MEEVALAVVASRDCAVDKRESILVITAAYPGHKEPFRASTVKRVVEGLAEKYRVAVLAPKIFSADPANESTDKITVHRFSFLSGEKILKQYSTLPPVRIMSYLANGVAAALLLARRIKPLAIYANWVIPAGFIGFIVSQILKIPLVVHAHGSDINIYAKQNHIFKWAAHLVIKNSHSILTVSEALRQEIANCFSISLEKVVVARPLIDSALFVPSSKLEMRKTLSLPYEKKIFLFVGDIIESKGCNLIYEAAQTVCRKYKEVLFLFIGDGPLRNRLVSLSRNDGFSDNLLFIGPVVNSKVAGFMQASDALLLPSYSEGLPVSVVEAVLCGLPVIASSVGGIPEIVKDGKNGLLVNAGSADSLCSAIERFLTQQGICEKLSCGAREVLKEISNQKEFRKILKVFESVPYRFTQKTPFYERFHLREQRRTSSLSRARTRAKEALSLLGSLEGKVLDVGCGNSILLEHLNKRGIEIKGVDVSREAVKLARQKGLNVNQLDIERDEINEKFDVVFCLEVLEHMRDSDKVLQKLAGILAPRGKLIISLPNEYNLWSRIKLIFSVKDTGHIHSFDLLKARELIDRAGLRREMEKYIPLLPESFSFGRILARVCPSLFVISYLFSTIRQK